MTRFLQDIGRFRRGAWEMLASVLIALGIVMLMQPWLIAAYTYSFLIIIIGTVSFIAATKFRE